MPLKKAPAITERSPPLRRIAYPEDPVEEIRAREESPGHTSRMSRQILHRMKYPAALHFPSFSRMNVTVSSADFLYSKDVRNLMTI